MPEGYAHTTAIWLPLAGFAFAVGMVLYCWRRRDVPAVRQLLYVFTFAAIYCLASTLGTAATFSETKVAWFKASQASLLPVLTAGTCFVLEYVFPGRWLTRRNLALLALPPLLLALLIFAGNGRFVWETLAVGPGGHIIREPGTAGGLAPIYALGLSLLNIAALLWVFVHSPLHRWPVALMLAGQMAGHIPGFVDAIRQPWTPSFNLVIAGILIWSAFLALAAFGFRMFDPLPFARQAVLEQMHAGILVFDNRWQTLSLNPAAEAILGITEDAARDGRWEELVQAARLPPELLLARAVPKGKAVDLPQIVLGSGHGAREYEPALSDLRDFRGLLLGYLLMLRDVTEQNRAQAQALGQQRALATQKERERMARELHDSLGQVLSYTSLQVETAAQLTLEGQGEAAAARLSRLGTVVRDAHADLRETILNLNTAARVDEPFSSVARQHLDGFTRSYDIRTQLHVDGDLDEGTLRPETKLHLLRILQEALSNARKHGQAHQVQVTLASADGCLRLIVEDNGCGFEPPGAAGSGGSHYGLGFMQARAEELGGSLDVTSSFGRGTRVVLQIPVNGAPHTEDGRP